MTGNEGRFAIAGRDGEARAFTAIPPAEARANVQAPDLDPVSAVAFADAAPEDLRKTLDAARQVAELRTQHGIADGAPIIVVEDETAVPRNVGLPGERGAPGKTAHTAHADVPDGTVVVDVDPGPTLLVMFAGRADKSVPKPYDVLPGGRIGRQDKWKGRRSRLAGFQRDRTVAHVDLPIEDVYADLGAAVGMFAVLVRADGEMATQLDAVESVQVCTGAVQP
uniref:hypothetical protein n=1 Tax=Amycolatopsis sp. CA-096443 TaxID=3239919 RepID=UPI003F490CBC